MSNALFVTGTGTDVGKTYISGLILKKLRENHLRAGYYKAAMSGNRRTPEGVLLPGDAWQVQQMSGIVQPLEEMCPYVYEAPVSPHLAAQWEGNPVELEVVLQGFDRVRAKYDYVLAEGSGGILCPLRADDQELYLEDVVRACGLTSLIVAHGGLGAIHGVGVTAAYMRARGLPVRGIILNHYQPGNRLHQDNRRMCQHVTGLPVVACVKEGDTDLDLSLQAVQALFA